MNAVSIKAVAEHASHLLCGVAHAAHASWACCAEVGRRVGVLQAGAIVQNDSAQEVLRIGNRLVAVVGVKLPAANTQRQRAKTAQLKQLGNCQGLVDFYQHAFVTLERLCAGCGQCDGGGCNCYAAAANRKGYASRDLRHAVGGRAKFSDQASDLQQIAVGHFGSRGCKHEHAF